MRHWWVLLAACRPASPTTASEPGLLEGVAFYQAVEVPVLRDGAAVTERAAPLVAGRRAVVRATVSDARDGLTVAVDVNSGGSAQTFSAEDGPVSIPADAMASGATYVVRLLQDGRELDRFPRAGDAALDVMVTGPLKVRLVPFEVNGFVPDTSVAVVDGYRDALMAVYPVTEVEVTVDPVQVWAGPFDLGDINVRVGEIQEAAMVAGDVGWDVYYYGMVTGVATREEYEGITGTSEAGAPGVTPVRAYFAAGAAFGDQRAEDTLIHEIGHTHRLLHAPCEADGTDPAFPYEGGVIGVEGFDLRTDTFVPPDTLDMMTNCLPRWISDYHFALLADHVAGAQSYSGFE